jgi:hypothetical protein
VPALHGVQTAAPAGRERSEGALGGEVGAGGGGTGCWVAWLGWTTHGRDAPCRQLSPATPCLAPSSRSPSVSGTPRALAPVTRAASRDQDPGHVTRIDEAEPVTGGIGPSVPSSLSPTALVLKQAGPPTRLAAGPAWGDGACRFSCPTRIRSIRVEQLHLQSRPPRIVPRPFSFSRSLALSAPSMPSDSHSPIIDQLHL